MKTDQNTPAPNPPSLVAALTAGFDAITNHIGLILIPMALDLLLWLGPHVRLSGIVNRLAAAVPAGGSVPGIDAAEMAQANQQIWSWLAEHLNLVFLMRTYPVGVASLMAGKWPVNIPGGSPVILEVNSLGMVLVWAGIFGLTGIAVGTFYFRLVADAAIGGKVRLQRAVREWPRNAAHVLVLALIWGLLLVAVTIPGTCIASALFLSNPNLARFSLFLYGGVVVWLLFPLLFSPHGIFVHRISAYSSLRRGLRLTRLTLPSSSLLFLLIFVISEGMDVLWKVPPDTSWITLLGVFGHAFVTTGLLAGTFVYYYQADQWLTLVYATRRSGQPPGQPKA